MYAFINVSDCISNLLSEYFSLIIIKRNPGYRQESMHNKSRNNLQYSCSSIFHIASKMIQNFDQTTSHTINSSEAIFSKCMFVSLKYFVANAPLTDDRTFPLGKRLLQLGGNTEMLAILFLKDARIRLIEDLLRNTEDPSKEPKEWGDLEGQSGLFVSALIAVERSRNFVDFKTILLENRKLIRLLRDFHWLRWLVRLDLIVSHSLHALLENIGSLPSLRDLNLPNCVDLSSLRSGAIIIPSKSKKRLEESLEHPLAGDILLSKEDPLHHNLVLFSRSGKEIHSPKPFKYKHLYNPEGLPARCGTLVIYNSGVLCDSFKVRVSVKYLWLQKPPEELLPCNPLSRKGPRCTTIISISSPGKLKEIHIQAILNRCRKSLKSGNRLAIFVRCNPVSKELDHLHIILDELSSINMLAFSLNGWESILILAELPVGPVYLPKEVPLQRIKNSVFLVYHGPDVREKFIHNLYESLSAGGVKVVNIDLNKWETERGKFSVLEQGWERTDIHIPIVSRHYEDSFFRHQGEFLRMCRSNCLIRPLFFEVEPTDIRRLYKSDSSVVATKDCSSTREINEFSDSPYGQPRMSFQTGWFLAGGRRSEQLVRRVVLENLQIVNNLPFHAVGLEERMRDVMDILKIESDDSLTVGICGSGGIGKTTLAKAISYSISFRFQAVSFVADVKRQGISEIQEQILKDLVGRCIFVKSVKHGEALVKANAGSIRALVILDDINSLRQLEAFSVDWLAPGSRVILTSRDDRLFSCGQTDGIYYINKLSDKESTELFNWQAFLREHPHYDYKGWSTRIVKACQGLPLLLEITGAFLYGNENVRDWESSTRYLEDTMDQEVHRRLLFSYQGLDPCEQEIFLDIACFFNAKENMETASRYWEAIGFSPRTALENLVLKSLIWMDEQNKFIMHDYVQEMGREIASKSPKLEERTRIWKPEEAMHISSRNLGTVSIQSISLSRVETSSVTVNAESLARMTNLNILWMDGQTVEGGYRKISRILRWLRWNSCPLERFPSRWRLDHLIVLDLSSVPRTPPTKLQSLWGVEASFSKKLGNLSVLRLKNATYLQKLPDDFSRLSSLSMLDLEKCENLRKLPSSIGCLGKLKSLNLSGCRNLVELPDCISKLYSLERLSLRHCFSLKEFPSAFEGLTALVELDAGFSGVDKLPSLQRLSQLEKLILTGCWSIRSLPHRIGQLANLKELDIHSLGLVKELPSLEKLSSLKTLVLNGCASLTSLPSSIGKLCRLEYLDMNGCRSIYRLPEEFGDLVRLKKLFMNNCFRLSMLPDSFGNLKSLTRLEIKHNFNLMRLPSSFSKLDSLLWLDASDCNLLEGLSERIGDLPALQFINLGNNFFRELSSTIHNLCYLRELNLSKCQYLERLPTLPTGLVKLDAGDCTQLKTIDDMSHLEKLKILILCNCENLIRLPELKSCQSLIMLNISRCRKVRSLAGAEGLSSLKTLYLSGSGVSASGLNQWIKDMPSLQELSVHANKIPQWLEHKSRDQYLQDQNFTDIIISPVNKTAKCGGLLLCFVLNFMYGFRSDESLPTNCMKMSIRGDDGKEFWSAVFSNRQKAEGDQLYICLYGINHPLTSKLKNIDHLHVMAKGTNIQIKECGMKLLYNGIGDLSLGRLEEDLSSLVANYIDEKVMDKVAAKETEFPHQTVYEEDGDVYAYEYSTSDDEYECGEDCNHNEKKGGTRCPWVKRP